MYYIHALYTCEAVYSAALYVWKSVVFSALGLFVAHGARRDLGAWSVVGIVGLCRSKSWISSQIFTSRNPTYKLLFPVKLYAVQQHREKESDDSDQAKL